MQRKKLTAADYIIALLFAATIIVVVAQVIFRYILNSSLSWTEELSRYLFSWIIFLGSAIALSNQTHIRVDFLVNKLPAKLSRGLKLFNYILILAFLVLVTVLGFMLVKLTANTKSPALSLPVNYVYYAAIPVTFLLGIYYTVRKITDMLAGRSKKEAG